MENETKMEKILTDPGTSRFSLFPIVHQDLWQFYKTHKDAFWTAEEIDLTNDQDDWNRLNENERYFIKNILAFFNQSDGIVNENLAENFLRDVKYPEAKCFYAFQLMMENIHSETYSLLIDTYVKDTEEKMLLFNAIENITAVKKKAEWALNWITNGDFAERLVAFAVVEGLFFSGSFCSIFWLKSQNKMPGLCDANRLIFKDENLHCDFAIHLVNNHLANKPSKERIREIILSALDTEKMFITESLPISLIGMNSNLMIQYLQFVADQLLLKFGCEKEFNSEQPFKFMEQIALTTKGNFFERRVVEYQKAKTNNDLTLTEDF